MPYVAQVAVGRRAALQIFGDDYDTPDGTGVRDYIHVCDLADGHVAALSRLFDGAASMTVNLGTGQGHSVMEVIDAFARVSGRPVPFVVAPRRPGDVAACYADPTRAGQLAGLAGPSRPAAHVPGQLALAADESTGIRHTPTLSRHEHGAPSGRSVVSLSSKRSRDTMSDISVQPVIIAGGSGTRLWPLSRATFPKQFLVLQRQAQPVPAGGTEAGRAGRRAASASRRPVWWATRSIVSWPPISLPRCQRRCAPRPPSLLEPTGRNTAPAMTLAALFALQDGQDPVLVVTPADQRVGDDAAYIADLETSRAGGGRATRW